MGTVLQGLLTRCGTYKSEEWCNSRIETLELASFPYLFPLILLLFRSGKHSKNREKYFVLTQVLENIADYKLENLPQLGCIKVQCSNEMVEWSVTACFRTTLQRCVQFWMTPFMRTLTNSYSSI